MLEREEKVVLSSKNTDVIVYNIKVQQKIVVPINIK